MAIMSWMAERDRLLAQTKAFVREVAAAHPKAAPSVLRESLVSGPPRSDAGIVNVPAVPRLSQGPAMSDPVPFDNQPFGEPHHSEPLILVEIPSKVESAIAAPPRTASGGEADNRIAVRSSSAHSQAADVVLTIPRVASSERDDIAIRVSHFREHQKRLSRERELFSEQMRARIKSVTGNNA